jgi:hypothetical protein
MFFILKKFDLILKNKIFTTNCIFQVIGIFSTKVSKSSNQFSKLGQPFNKFKKGTVLFAHCIKAS